jgi:hypothetical protein
MGLSGKRAWNTGDWWKSDRELSDHAEKCEIVAHAISFRKMLLGGKNERSELMTADPVEGRPIGC